MVSIWILKFASCPDCSAREERVASTQIQNTNALGRTAICSRHRCTPERMFYWTRPALSSCDYLVLRSADSWDSRIANNKEARSPFSDYRVFNCYHVKCRSESSRVAWPNCPPVFAWRKSSASEGTLRPADVASDRHRTRLGFLISPCRRGC